MPENFSLSNQFKIVIFFKIYKDYMFSANTYLNRRSALAADLANNGIILLTGNTELPMNYKGNTFRFRQDSNFLYFTGIDLPLLYVTIDTGTGETTLFGDNISVEDAVWTGTLPKLEEWAARSGISKVKPLKSLPAEIGNGKKIHYLPPYPANRKIFLSELFNRPIAKIENEYSTDLIRALVKQRSIKTNEEIVQIEETMNNVTSVYHIEAMKMALPGEYEYKIAGHIEGTMLKHNCTPAFNIICSVHGEILHNNNYSNQLIKNQLLLIDSGAENNMHYATDITRTTPVGGKFNQQQKEIYELVLAANQQSIASIKPGTTYKDIHLQAARILAEGLLHLNLMKGNADDIVAQGAHALFFPHGLGHMMGLDVHDMEDLGENFVGYDETISRSTVFGTAYLRMGRALREGFVLTVEPGLYFIPVLIEKWKSENKFSQYINYKNVEKYINFGGIRIEDNVCVTQNGCKLLGRAIPKTVKEIESLF
ncbi:MAG: aminopeptidase P family protein [Bacteroidales bacterium]|nr:aminopeptidase P family protein [Bacteroidales bacterium]